MTKKLLTLLGALGATAFAASNVKQSEESSIKIIDPRVAFKNTNFHVVTELLISDRGEEILRGVDAKNHSIFIKSVMSGERILGAEFIGGPMELTAFNAAQGQELWKITSPLRSEFDFPRSTYTVRTKLDGCCGSESSYRLYGLYSGKEILHYMLSFRGRLPAFRWC